MLISNSLNYPLKTCDSSQKEAHWMGRILHHKWKMMINPKLYPDRCTILVNLWEGYFISHAASLMAFHLSRFYRKSVFHHHFHYIVFLFFSSAIYWMLIMCQGAWCRSYSKEQNSQKPTTLHSSGRMTLSFPPLVSCMHTFIHFTNTDQTKQDEK